MKQKNNTTATLLIGNSLILTERLGFYLLLLFLIPHLSSEEVRLNEYDVMPLLILLMNAGAFARIFGGVIIDFLTGIRFGLQLSLALQILGVVLLTQSNLSLIFLGIIPYVIGQALFMPAILKWNVLQAKDSLFRLPTFNYANYFFVNLAAILLFFTQYFVLKNYSLPVPFLFVFPACAFAITLLLPNKSAQNQLQETSPHNHSTSDTKNLGIALLGFACFYFLFNIVSKQLNILSNVFENLSSLEKYPNTMNMMLLVVAMTLLPPMTMFIVTRHKSVSSFLFNGIFFAISGLTSIALLILTKELIINFELRIVIVMVHISIEGFIAPLLLSTIQQYSNIKHVGTWTGIGLSFSGFISIYIGDKLFNLNGVLFGDSRSSTHTTILLLSIIGFLIFAGTFLILYLKTKRKEIKQFEDLSNL
jgi:hypothetical protein